MSCHHLLLSACCALLTTQCSGAGSGPPSTPPVAGLDAGRADRVGPWPFGPEGALDETGFSDGIRILVEPSDDGAALVAAIRSARRRIHVIMYLLTSDAVIGALSDQRRAGREVKVVLNRTFPYRGAPNDEAFRRLREAGVSVTYGPDAFRYTHAKCVVLDDTEAWIMTMNATASSPKENREYLAVDTDAADVAQLEALFAGDFGGAPVAPAGKLVVSPLNAHERLRALIDGSVRSLDVQAETLSESSIVKALAAASDRGVTVRVVVADAVDQPGEREAVTTLMQHGIAVVAVSRPFIHAKAIVADASRAYVGSVNFTAASLFQNREVGALFSAPAEVAKVAATIDSDFRAGRAF